MKRRIASAIRRVGHVVTLSFQGKSGEVYASLQPKFSEATDISGPAGHGFTRRYTLYAPASNASWLLQEGCLVTRKSQIYRVQRAEAFRLKEEVLYFKADLVLWKEE